MEKGRCNFELFKSNICHRVKEMGDIAFIIDILEGNDIRLFYDIKYYRECFYLLAMLDYLSRLNDVPLCTNYNDIRNYKLEEMVYPADILIMCAAAGNDSAKRRALKEAIPEFLKFNIVESDIRNVV